MRSIYLNMYVDMLEQKVPDWRLVNSARQLQNSLRTWTCESETVIRTDNTETRSKSVTLTRTTIVKHL